MTVGRTLREESLPLLSCCLALLLCVLISHPFVDSAFDDDWSYSHVALRLAQTGRFQYNGWGSPTIVVQSLWGALFIRLFGFSFDVLRWATLPFSCALVAITYLLGRRVGLRRDFACLGAVSLACAPLFVPLAATFMTEPYSCFFGIVCVYTAIECADSADSRKAFLWLTILTLSGILGGANRQTVWAAPLCLIPYLAWVHSADRRFRVAAGGAFLTVILFLFLVTHYFSQKYSPLEMGKGKLLHLAYDNGYASVHLLQSLLLVGAMLCLPALACYLARWRTISLKHLAGILFLSFLAYDYCRSGIGDWGVVPFCGNILNARGILARWNNGLGYRPALFGHVISYGLTYVMLLSGIVAAYFSRKLYKGGDWQSAPSFVFVFLLFILSYLPFLVPGAILILSFDRYILPILPLLLIFALLPAQQLVKRVPVYSWVIVLGFAAYSVLTTHDYFASLRARTAAGEQAVSKGIHPDHVSVGFESDGWKQLQMTGHIATSLYDDQLEFKYNHFWFWFYSTAIHPDFVAISSDANRVPKEAKVVVPFETWARPFHRAISVVPRADIPRDQDLGPL